MVWFLVEVLVAVSVLLGAVWWTMRSRRPDEPVPSDDDTRDVPPRDPDSRR